MLPLCLQEMDAELRLLGYGCEPMGTENHVCTPIPLALVALRAG